MERRQFLTASMMGAISAGLSVPALATEGSGDATLNALFDTLFYEGFDLSPQNATIVGFDKGPRAALKSKLDDRSSLAFGKSRAWCTSALQRLGAINPASLSPIARRQRELAIWYQNQALIAAKLGFVYIQSPYVLSHQNGASFELPAFLDSLHTVATPEDAEAYLARLDAIDHAIDQDIERQKEFASNDLIAPAWSLEMALGQIRALRKTAPEDSSMVQSLKSRTAAKGITGDWATRAAAIVADKIYPALERQISYIERLKMQSPAGDGIWRVKDGDALYASALAEATTTSLAPAEVHKIGLEQVADLSARLDSVLREAGLTRGSIGARLAELNKRPDQLYANTDEGRAALMESLNASLGKIRKLLPRAFNDIPDDPLEIRRVPPEIEKGAPNGYYYPATLDGSRPGIYWINLRDTHNWPKYGLPDLTYHEGIPGHHLQISYVNRAGNLPLLLRGMFNPAYSEGWALYAEELASDLGAFSGVERAGVLQSLLFRAARLVVDTGIHAKRWSREKAIAYLIETTGFPEDRGRSEINRYICMIGQACSYKIGHNVWIRLRDKAREALGEQFSLGWFHEILKEGNMPLSMLETRIDEHIAAARLRKSRLTETST